MARGKEDSDLQDAFLQIMRSVDANFNHSPLIVVDLLHEFELGVWKAVFTHLMRILFAAGGTLVAHLNYRYRRVPTFGRATIRRFSRNVSTMKHLAAQDFEDLLQCALPVFEGLLPPPHNNIILDLLFDLATWHAFAKLRLHTDQTLNFFDSATAYVGRSVPKFQRTTCVHYRTNELPQEHAARSRRTAALATRQNCPIPAISPPKVKKLNLSTDQFHALGSCPDTIRRYGTTGNYSIRMGELERRRVKRLPRSGKKDTTVESAQKTIEQENANSQPRHARASLMQHYAVAQSSRKGEDLTAWLGKRRDDPAFKDFLPILKDYLLTHARGLAYDGKVHNFSDDDRDCINIKDNNMYHHALLHVNYTTYDLQRKQDIIHPLTRPDVMVLSNEAERTHPYWYARVVHIFHVMVEHREDVRSSFSDPVRMDVLFVRWFRRDVDYASGWSSKRLHRLQFENSSDAFSFLDPDAVIRGVHLVPAFNLHRTNVLLGPSRARRMEGDDATEVDWKYYHVNMFVDRDMFMRFRGGGVGHKGTWD